MANEGRTKFSFFRDLGWKLLLLSLILVGGAAYLLKEMFYPYQFTVLENAREDVDGFRTYHDFDGDGLSECIEVKNHEPDRHFIHVKSWNGGIVDQANYYERIDVGGLMFADVTGDAYHEIIAFTQKADSLYVYVHDLVSKQAVITRRFLFCVEEPLTPHYRQVDCMPACVADTTVYRHKVILFAARSYAALRPRTVFAFDLDSQTIIRQFETRSALTQIFSYDLTGDGVDEIVVAGVAYGNVHYPAQYRDDKCWLFVLDQRLNPLFPPLSFSEYPSGFLCLPVEAHSEKYILVAPDYLGEKNLYDYLYLINGQGKVHLRVKNPYAGVHESYPVVSDRKNPTEIYGGKGDNQLIKLNERLETVQQESTPFDRIRAVSAKDLNADGREELLCVSENYLLLYDDSFGLMAKFPIPTSQIRTSFREMGKGNPLEIGLSVDGQFYRLSVSPNKVYSYFPLVLAGLTVVVFVLLAASHRVLSLTANRNRMLRYLHYDSSEGVLVVDNRCFIIFANSKVAQLLNLHHPPARGENAVSILHHARIVQLLKKSIADKERVDDKVMLGDDESGFEGEISVQPYRYFFKRAFNYLVVIRSASIPSHSDQIHSWSKAVQKMAHDIKTPLSTVSLNLRVLQTRLEKIHLSETEHRDLSDDITMMRTELDNIQSVTRNFLKFSNLDKPHFQAFGIQTVIEQATRRFQPYVNADFSIEVSIDNDVKPVWADPQQIEMVFTILLENALAAMQGKGSINIQVSLVQFLDAPFSESLEIEVADTGHGIGDEDHKRIFEPYFSTKPEGTGMGLAIAKKIIQDNGGFIEVHSKPQFGAVFRFSVPVIKE
jgi:two-component system nitrogen regulation sensor histidine kinase NtrY